MAQFYEGGRDMFNAITHSDPHPNTVSFLENMVSQPTQAIGAATQQFMAGAQEAYDQFVGSTAMRRIRAAGRQLRSQWDRDIVRPLTTTAELQTAPLTMHRWLMAEPTIRRLYHKQQCDGYSDTYVDAQPEAIGEAHYDYRRVMNGIVEETEDSWCFTEYLDELREGDKELMFEDQFDILRSWSSLASAVFEGGDDPTSRWNAEL